MSEEVVQRCLDNSGLNFELRREQPAAYLEACLLLSYFPYAYSPSELDYQMSYYRQGADFGRADMAMIDFSLVIKNDRTPCGVWPLTLCQTSTGWMISTVGGPILPPLFVQSISTKTANKLTRQCLRALDSIIEELGIRAIYSAVNKTDQTALTDWQLSLMSKGATILVQHELLVDLSLDSQSIRTHFRKSYKPLISVAERTWNADILREPDPAIWEEFRLLHQQVSGRVTRSIDSWDAQHQDIGAGNAFLIYLRDQDKKMVGAGFFNLTRDESSYSVAAYDRSLFDKPLGHLVQARAILESKERGVRWYRIGRRFFLSDSPAPTEKELSISMFKEGFATHVFPKYVLSYSPKL